jgi:hypothetical protein
MPERENYERLAKTWRRLATMHECDNALLMIFDVPSGRDVLPVLDTASR